MSDKSDIIYAKLHESQERYTYYILGLTVVAIGFIIVNNQIIELNLLYLPLGISLLLLSISFLFGLKHIEYKNSVLYANFELLKVEAGEHEDLPMDIQYIKAASDGIRSAIRKNINRAQTFGKWQNIIMIIGFLSYFVFIIIKPLKNI